MTWAKIWIILQRQLSDQDKNQHIKVNKNINNVAGTYWWGLKSVMGCQSKYRWEFSSKRHWHRKNSLCSSMSCSNRE